MKQKPWEVTIAVWLGDHGWFWEFRRKIFPGQAIIHAWNKKGYSTKASARRAALVTMRLLGLVERKVK